MGKFFISRLPRSRGQPGLSYELIYIFTKKRVARQDLGSRASPFNWVHIKRPLESLLSVPRSLLTGLDSSILFIYFRKLASINEMPAPDAVFVFSYKIFHNRFRMIRV